MGAVDSDLGEVTSAYRMVLPPRFGAGDTDSLFVTPDKCGLGRDSQAH